MSDDKILTPSQTIGPLFGFALLPKGITETIDPSDAEAVVIEGALLDGNGQHLRFEVMLEFWSEGQACRVRTIDGRFRAVLRRPQPELGGDGSEWAPHLNVNVFARGLNRHVVTRVYFPDEPRNAADPVLQQVAPERRQTLIARPGAEPRHFDFDIHLQGEQETVFFRLSDA